jgi:asparaginyl-tRNA synthetase
LNTYLATEDPERIFVQVQPPIITSSDCEGAGEVFTVVSNAEGSSPEQVEKKDTTPSPASFFRTPRYLSVSSQLHLEAYAAELQNVWALSPTFRAEKSDTPRHLAEFYMLEVETSYTTSLREMTLLVERLIRFVTSQLMKKQPFEEVLLANRANTEDGAKRIEEIRRRWAALLGEPWKSASYSYCIKRLREAAAADPKRFERQPEFGSGLQLEHERWIAENIGQNRPIFVTHYPQALKPFYMAPSLLAKDHCRHPAYRRPGESDLEHFEDSETGEDTVACFDLLLPFGVSEVAGGSLREHRLENLIQNMRQHGMLKPKSGHSSSTQANEVPNSVKSQEDAYPYLEPGESLGSLKWYADLRRHGTMPHGGFGIGVDRLIAYLTGVHNLRDVVSFPRTFGRADC